VDTHVCGRVKGRAAHDLKIGRVHLVGSMKEKREGWEGVVYMRVRDTRGFGVDWLAVMG